ncbi:hypothetical protein N9L68_05170 [bacterium]|nr:hypothetical protein [bacterium]
MAMTRIAEISRPSQRNSVRGPSIVNDGCFGGSMRAVRYFGDGSA